MKKLTCTVLLGPTAVGKSTFLYRHFGDAPIEIISADSMQVYRHFDVATATPEEELLSRLPHVGINERDPDEEYSVSEFRDRADDACERALSRGRLPVLVGGTALYLRTFLFGMDDLPPANEEFRDRMRSRVEETSSAELHAELESVDPQAAENIHPNDTKRVIRALEIHHETGRTKTELTRGSRTIRPELDPLIVGLKRPRHELHGRIRNRVEEMLEEGLIDEVRRLINQWDVSDTLRQAIGFESVQRHLEGEFSRQEVLENMVEKTREFARKQMSWFRRFPVDRWYHPEQQERELIRTVEQPLKRTV